MQYKQSAQLNPNQTKMSEQLIAILIVLFFAAAWMFCTRSTVPPTPKALPALPALPVLPVLPPPEYPYDGIDDEYGAPCAPPPPPTLQVLNQNWINRCGHNALWGSPREKVKQLLSCWNKTHLTVTYDRWCGFYGNPKY